MNYEVDMQTLSTDISSMETTVASIRSNMTNMFDEITALETMWEGPAKEAFKQQFLLDQAAFEELCTAIDGMIDSMKEANTTYQNCEEQVGEVIDTIKI